MNAEIKMSTWHLLYRFNSSGGKRKKGTTELRSSIKNKEHGKESSSEFGEKS